MRVAVGVEYEGSEFSGFEDQRCRRTVQGVLEAALAKVAHAPVKVVCAGRTDAGVHALGQVVHFDTRVSRPDRAWVMGTNTHLPGDVAVTWARRLAEPFHARYSALRRHYRYVMYNRPTRSPLYRRRAAWAYRPLDADRMQAAADHLVGRHDFSAYRAAGCQAKNPVREVYRVEVRRRGELVLIDVCANAFLQHMVRNIAGVLLSIGGGKHDPVWARGVLESRDRRRGGVTAPAEGLYFNAVEYPERFAVPAVSPERALW